MSPAISNRHLVRVFIPEPVSRGQARSCKAVTNRGPGRKDIDINAKDLVLFYGRQFPEERMRLKTSGSISVRITAGSCAKMYSKLIWPQLNPKPPAIFSQPRAVTASSKVPVPAVRDRQLEPMAIKTLGFGPERFPFSANC